MWMNEYFKHLNAAEELKIQASGRPNIRIRIRPNPVDSVKIRIRLNQSKIWTESEYLIDIFKNSEIKQKHFTYKTFIWINILPF